MERVGSSPPGEGFMRNGHRQQSPQPANRSPHPYPAPNGPSPSLSQNMASIHSPQPRAPNNQPFDEYTPSRPAPIPAATSPRSASRPNSYALQRSTDEPSSYVTPASGTPRL